MSIYLRNKTYCVDGAQEVEGAALVVHTHIGGHCDVDSRKLRLHRRRVVGDDDDGLDVRQRLCDGLQGLVEEHELILEVDVLGRPRAHLLERGEEAQLAPGGKVTV